MRELNLRNIVAVSLLVTQLGSQAFASTCSTALRAKKGFAFKVYSPSELGSKEMAAINKRISQLEDEKWELRDKISEGFEFGGFGGYGDDEYGGLSYDSDMGFRDFLQKDSGPFDSKVTKPAKSVKKDKLGAKEKAAIKKKISLTEKQIENLEAEHDKLGEKLTVDVRADIKARISKDMRFANKVKDYLNSAFLKEIVRTSTSVVLLAVDYPENANRSKIKGEILALVKGLKAKGFLIVYDGHSSFAGDISKEAGANGFAVVEGNVSGLQNQLVISNPYLRLETLGDIKKIVISPYSVLGSALRVLDPSLEIWNIDNRKLVKLEDWDRTTKGRMPKARVGNAPIIKNTKEYVESLYARSESLTVNDIKTKVTQLQDLEFSELADLMAYVETLTFAEENTADKGGAVVFGSSSEEKESVAKLADIVQHLGRKGYPIFTGGAGGMMLVANKAATKVKAESIGVPMGGKFTLASEKEVFEEALTRRINTVGYETRIPVLLQGREVVVVAPGGNGTLRELATFLISLQTMPIDKMPALVFVDKIYYQHVLNWIRDFGLPEEIQKNIYLVDSAQELAKQVRGLR